MDFEMPVMNGLEATEKIRALQGIESKNKVKIIGLTGHERESSLKTARRHGMDDVVCKPVTS